MKKKFNFYCVLMLVALLFASMVPHIFTFSTGFLRGWSSSDAKELQLSGVSRAVQLLPKKNMLIFNDSIMNTKTGEMNGVQILQAFVNSPSANRSDYALQDAAMGVCGVAATVLLVIFLVLFVKIILAVNRKEIFDVRMERRLSWIGCILLTHYALGWILLLANYQITKEVFDFADYNIIISEGPHMSYLLAGIGMLLIAQIFCMARRMKEEQDLTV